MPSSNQNKQLGLKKETVRGTAETAPDTWLGISADSNLEFRSEAIQDEMLVGVNATLPSAPGIQDGDGTINTSVRAQNIGELLQMCLGDPVTTETIPATVYKHAFSPPASTIQLPTYTMFMKRDNLSVKKYNRCTVSQLNLTLPVDNLAQLATTVLFEKEETGSFGSPSYTESEELAFQHAAITLGGVSNCDIRDFNLSFANGAVKQRTLCQTRVIKDIIAVGKHTISGGFTIYFENETERDKYIANTQSSLILDLQGDIISGAEKYYLKITLDKILYTAFPYGESDGMIAAQVTFQAEYDSSNSRLGLIELQNVKASY